MSDFSSSQPVRTKIADRRIPVAITNDLFTALISLSGGRPGYHDAIELLWYSGVLAKSNREYHGNATSGWKNGLQSNAWVDFVAKC